MKEKISKLLHYLLGILIIVGPIWILGYLNSIISTYLPDWADFPKFVTAITIWFMCIYTWLLYHIKWMNINENT
jgi:hypothetical protein